MKSSIIGARFVLIVISTAVLFMVNFSMADQLDANEQMATKSSLDNGELFAYSDVEYIRSYVPVKLPRLRSAHHDHDDQDDVDVQLVLEFAVQDSRRRFSITLRPIAGVVSSTTNVSTVSWHDGRRPVNTTRLGDRWRRYEGRLDDDPHSLVSGHAVHGFFTGFLNTANETYFVEPASDYFPDTHRHSKFNAILYKASDVYSCPSNADCLNSSSTSVPDAAAGPGTNGSLSSLRRVHWLPVGFYRHMLNLGEVRRRRQRDAQPKVESDPEAARIKATAYLCELRIIADFRWYRYVARRNSTYGSELVESLLHRVDTIFRSLDLDGDDRPDNVGFMLRDLDIYIDPVLPIFDTVDDNWDPKAFFDEFHTFNFDGVCAGLLFTYRRMSFDNRFNVPTIPKTNIATLEQGICSRYVPPPGPDGLRADYGIYVANALPVNFMSWNKVASASAIVVETAHQLAHLFGAKDDVETDDPRCRPVSYVSRNYIMAYPLVSADVERNFRWSPCSQDSIEAYLAGIDIRGRTCLKPCLGASCLKERWSVPAGTHRSEVGPRLVRQDTPKQPKHTKAADTETTTTEAAPTTKAPTTEAPTTEAPTTAATTTVAPTTEATVTVERDTTTTSDSSKAVSLIIQTQPPTTEGPSTCDVESPGPDDADEGGGISVRCSFVSIIFSIAFTIFLLQ